jgi:hypothetical protein
MNGTNIEIVKGEYAIKFKYFHSVNLYNLNQYL